jgi:serine O-acetyltransferase
MFERMKEDIQMVFSRDPAPRSTLEVVLLSPGLHAIWLHRLGNWFWTRNHFFWGRFVSTLNRFITGVEIHPGATIGKRVLIDHGMGVVIGETAIIGDDCTLYHGVTLGGTTWDKGKRHPTLHNGVIIGAGAKVLGPIEIGAGARVGSNSVVLKPVPAGATVVGIPGHIIGTRAKKAKTERDEIAKKMGFDAYGTTADMPDPVANAINRMLDHIHLLDKQIETMQKALHDAGINCKETPISTLDGCEIADGYEKGNRHNS